MYTYIFNPYSTKAEFYKDLEQQVKVLLEGQRNWVTNLANAAAIIFHGMNTLKVFQDKPVNWAGFYIRETKHNDFLILGPFQGKVACTKIRIADQKGVCGTAAWQKSTQVVANVHEFPGHIACDSASKSEIVVPLIDSQTDEVIGVLDIDDQELGAFNNEDKEGLEAIAKLIVQACDWNWNQIQMT